MAQANDDREMLGATDDGDTAAEGLGADRSAAAGDRALTAV